MEMRNIDLISTSKSFQFYRLRLLVPSMVSVTLLTVFPSLYSADNHDVENLSLMGDPLHFNVMEQGFTINENIMYLDEFLQQKEKSAEILYADENTRQRLEETVGYRTVLNDIREKALQYFPYLRGMSVLVHEGTKDLSVDLLVESPIGQALGCLEQFDNGWWLDYDSANKDKICIDVVSV